MSNTFGFISNIQRFSTEDGPGIRTTVFLKGCPLRCIWCHNPETFRRERELLYYRSACSSCGLCAGVCGYGAHIMNAVTDRHEFIRQNCTACGACAGICPNNALVTYGVTMDVPSLMEVITSDSLYYSLSGGGVTLSGGEPLAQADFCADAAKSCHELGYHVIIDTSGNADYSAFERVMPFTDLFYYDIKCSGSDDYLKYTGGDFALILDNLKRLVSDGANVEARIPVIPSVNDSIDKARLMSELIADTGVETVWLLPYHRLGNSKYSALDMDIKFDSDIKCDCSALAPIYRQHGLTVYMQ